MASPAECDRALATSTCGKKKEMEGPSTEESRDATSWSCGEHKGHRPRASETATWAAKSGLSRNDTRRAREDGQSSKGGGCKDECRSCV